jgi:hypothetical protein
VESSPSIIHARRVPADPSTTALLTPAFYYATIDQFRAASTAEILGRIAIAGSFEITLTRT